MPRPSQFTAGASPPEGVKEYPVGDPSIGGDIAHRDMQFDCVKFEAMDGVYAGGLLEITPQFLAAAIQDHTSLNAAISAAAGTVTSSEGSAPLAGAEPGKAFDGVTTNDFTSAVFTSDSANGAWWEACWANQGEAGRVIDSITVVFQTFERGDQTIKISGQTGDRMG